MILKPLPFGCCALGAVLVLAGLVGCETPPPPTPQQQAAIAACRSQAEQQFLIQNRSSLYQPDSSLTPYASTTPQFAQVQSLADQYSHRQMVQDCLRGASGPSPIAPAPARASAAPPPPPLPPAPPPASPPAP
ncbi:MAG TPA: hypothetical protein VMA37_13745 [Acetobacteraceae bacterium]|nr:hypothetical protein [Acetobacteraceae bacterium]